VIADVADIADIGEETVSGVSARERLHRQRRPHKEHGEGTEEIGAFYCWIPRVPQSLHPWAESCNRFAVNPTG
jgi:hypothetical protein